ncbi:MAG TPA: response regulator [Aggregatilineales bacterium]|nr:response regulator [Aggregatilineales bacterium]
MSTTRALIIDDNSMNGDVLATLLANEGIESTTVVLPKNLAQIIGQLSPLSVVFLDLEFPSHSGFDLLKELKEMPELHDVPIVAYSVHTSEIDTVRKAGFHSFLGKPVTASRFAQNLRRILDGEPIWEA